MEGDGLLDSRVVISLRQSNVDLPVGENAPTHCSPSPWSSQGLGENGSCLWQMVLLPPHPSPGYLAGALLSQQKHRHPPFKKPILPRCRLGCSTPSGRPPRPLIGEVPRVKGAPISLLPDPALPKEQKVQSIPPPFPLQLPSQHVLLRELLGLVSPVRKQDDFWESQ